MPKRSWLLELLNQLLVIQCKGVVSLCAMLLYQKNIRGIYHVDITESAGNAGLLSEKDNGGYFNAVDA